MKTIYFVRHGVTASNEGERYQHADEPLSEKGIKQAEFLAKRFKSIPVDVIFASTMERASHTAKIIGKEIGKEVIETDLLGEVSRPSIVRGKSKNDPEVQAIMKEIEWNYLKKPEWRHSDEENFPLAIERGQKALDFILSREEEKILVVSHGMFLKTMIALIIHSKNLTPEMWVKIRFVLMTSNTGLTKIEYNDRGWFIKTWNDHEHLGEVK